MFEQLKVSGKRIIFVRHGESIGNARGLDDASLSDTPNHRFPLTEQGRQQARRAGTELKAGGLVWQQAFFSSYLRAEETYREIEAVYPCCPQQPIMDPRLDEWWRGIWHTMGKDDIARLYPLEKKIQEREGWYHYRAVGGQSGPDVELQIRSFLSDFLYGCHRDLSTILIVGHGKWAILFWRVMNGATVGEAKKRLDFSPFGNCSVSIFDAGFFKSEFFS